MLYSIIVPTYNEKDNLPIIFYLLYETLRKEKIDFEVVIVDDSSPDGTYEVAKKLQAEFGNGKIQILKREGKLGLGSAYIAGLKIAKGDRIVIMDADFGHHPKFIPQMIKVMDNKNNKNKIHIVTGTRYLKGGGVSGWNLKRKLTSAGANFLATFLLNPSNLSDLTGSFRLYERSVIESILPKVISKGYAFQMEIMVLALKADYNIAEVPITFVDRVFGESKLGTKEILLYLKGVLYLFFTT